MEVLSSCIYSLGSTKIFYLFSALVGGQIKKKQQHNRVKTASKFYLRKGGEGGQSD